MTDLPAEDADPTVVRPDAMLCFNLYAASHAFTRFYKPILEPLGLTYPQYLVLLSLGREDGQGVGRLSDELHLETNTLSPLLKRLDAAGLVRRLRGSEDERRVSVHLTEAGKRIAAEAARIPEGILGRLDLSAAELDRCSETLRKLRLVLAAATAPHGAAPA